MQYIIKKRWSVCVLYGSVVKHNIVYGCRNRRSILRLDICGTSGADDVLIIPIMQC
jgi:hypothetical protein